MKKFLAVLTLFSVMLCAVACTMPTDSKDAKKNLKDADYDVEITDDSDEIEYLVEDFGGDADGIEEVLFASDEDGEDALFMFFCEDIKTAKSLGEDLTDFYEDEFEDLADEEDIDIDDYAIEVSGKVVVFGHVDMIDAVKG